MILDFKNKTLQIDRIQMAHYYHEWFNDFKQLNIMSHTLFHGWHFSADGISCKQKNSFDKVYWYHNTKVNSE